MIKLLIRIGAVIGLFAIGSVVVSVVGFIIGVIVSIGLFVLTLFTAVAGYFFIMTDYSDDGPTDSGSNKK
jgi:hypothetical protein